MSRQGTCLPNIFLLLEFSLKCSHSPALGNLQQVSSKGKCALWMTHTSKVSPELCVLPESSYLANHQAKGREGCRSHGHGSSELFGCAFPQVHGLDAHGHSCADKSPVSEKKCVYFMAFIIATWLLVTGIGQPQLFMLNE